MQMNGGCDVVMMAIRSEVAKIKWRFRRAGDGVNKTRP